MPGGVPIELTPDEAALYSSIGAMISAGYGADRAYKALREADAYVPRATVRAVAGEIRESLSYRPELGRLQGGNPIPERLVSYNSSLHTDAYLQKVQMLLYEPITGTTFTQFFTYRSDELASPDEIFGAAVDEDSDSPTYQEYDVLSMSLFSVETAR